MPGLEETLNSADLLEKDPALTVEQIAAQKAAEEAKAAEAAAAKAAQEERDALLQQADEADKEGLIDVPKDKRREYNPFKAAHDWKKKFTQQEAENKRLADEKAALEARIQALATPPKEEKVDTAPKFEEDPANFLKLKTDTVESQLQQLRQQQESMQQQQAIRQQIDAFKVTHPDYDDALNHLVAKEMEAWDKAGGMRMLTKKLIANNRQGVEDYGRQYGMSLDDAALAIAKGTIYAAREQQVIEIARSEGKTVPEVAYVLASVYGYAAKEVEKKPSAEDAKRVEQEARERVERAKAQSALEGSVNLSSVGNGPAHDVLSKKDYMEFQATATPLELAQFVMAKEIEDPTWFYKLT